MNTMHTDPTIKKLIEDLKPKRPKVLIAEDEALDAEIMQTLLLELNCECVTARDGRTALELLNQDTQKEIELIFLDLRFNEGPSGIDVLKWLKSNRPHVPVIVVSGYVDFDQTLRKVGGYVAAIQKPFSQGDLKEILQKHKLLTLN